jgi:glucose-6-phosphate 1-epimerase
MLVQLLAAFPQFADAGDLPLHGFARTCLWHVVSAHHGQPGTSITLGLSDSAQTRAVWPHKFELLYTVTLTPLAISFQLEATNTDTTAWSFTGCIHTYLRFTDTKVVELHGFGGTQFVDKCDGRKVKMQDEGAVITAESASAASGTAAGKKGFVDRIYLNSPTECEVRLKGVGNTKTLYHVQQSASYPDTTLYNPWTGDKLGGAAAGLDFDEDGYQHMFCVEPTVNEPISVGPGKMWVGCQQIALADPHVP